MAGGEGVVTCVAERARYGRGKPALVKTTTVIPSSQPPFVSFPGESFPPPQNSTRSPFAFLQWLFSAADWSTTANSRIVLFGKVAPSFCSAPLPNFCADLSGPGHPALSDQDYSTDAIHMSFPFL
jgi:hypothetical protein